MADQKAVAHAAGRSVRLATVEPTERAEASSYATLLKAAEKQGLMGVKNRQLGGRFPNALVEAAQKASGIIEMTELLTYALARVAFEDRYGEKLLTLEGAVPRGTFLED